MDQLGHTDPAFTLRVYRHGMRRDPASKRALRELVGLPVEQFDWAAMGSSGVFGGDENVVAATLGHEKTRHLQGR
jgi:hypothetical protein